MTKEEFDKEFKELSESIIPQLYAFNEKHGGVVELEAFKRSRPTMLLMDKVSYYLTYTIGGFV